MSDPIETWIGFTLLGFGSLVVYSEWNHVPGGATAVLKQTISTGKLPPLKSDANTKSGGQTEPNQSPAKVQASQTNHGLNGGT